MMSYFRTGSVSRTLRHFGAARDGNIAVIFGIVLVPLISFIGAAVDYSRYSNARSSVQAALDSASLMVSKDLAKGAITSSQVSAKGQAYFDALYTNKDATGITVTTSYTAKDSSGSSTIVMNGSGSMATDFMRVAGYPNLSFSTGSTATWGGTRLRVALALDTTGSMNDDGKLAAMQTAAKQLIDTLAAMAKTVDDVYVSVIPFAEMVNVGTSNKNASWIDWTDWEEVNGDCSRGNSSTKTSCQNAGRTWTPNNHNTWTGCVTDRDQPYDTTSATPTSSSTDYPANQTGPSGSGCTGASMLVMTPINTASNVTTVKNKIGSLTAVGGTNQAIGMAWAWTSLLPGVPLAAPAKDVNYQYTDAIVLLSDGLNTIDRWYGNGSSPSSQVDARQKLLCDNIKTPVSGKSVVIYTIQVNTSGDPASAVLSYCANSGNFYSTTTASGIADAFSAIGTSLSKLRVSK